MKTILPLLLLTASLAFGQPFAPSIYIGTGLASATNAPTESIAWYPTNASASVTQWIAADSLSLNDGDPVSSWTALKGSTLTNGGATRPIFKTAVLNSKPVVRFDGGATDGGNSQMLQGANWGSPIAQPFTVGLVVKHTGDNVNTRAPFCATQARVNVAYTTAGKVNYYAENGAGAVDIADSDTNWHTVLIEFNGASSASQIDGGAWTTASASPGSYGMSGLLLGCVETRAHLFFQGDIAEIVIWSGQLTGGERYNAVTNYLRAKWIP